MFSEWTWLARNLGGDLQCGERGEVGLAFLLLCPAADRIAAATTDSNLIRSNLDVALFGFLGDEFFILGPRLFGRAE